MHTRHEYTPFSRIYTNNNRVQPMLFELSLGPIRVKPGGNDRCIPYTLRYL